MNSTSSFSGIECVGEVPWGSHFCQFYKTGDDLADALVPYFKAGLENNEQCLWVTAEPFCADDARAALLNAVPDLGRRVKKGQIEIVDHSQWYTRVGALDADDVLNGWVQTQERALENGFKGLRLTGYECRVNHTFRNQRIIALCSYCLEKCPSEGILDVVKNHEFALIRRSGDWHMIENSSLKIAKSELSRVNAELEAHVADRTAELEDLLHQHEAVEEFTQRMIQSSQDCIKLLDLDGKLQFMSQGGQALLEIEDLSRFLGTSWSDLWAEEWRDEAAKAVQIAALGGTGHLSGYCPTTSGKPKWWDVIVTPILDKKGKPHRLLAVSRDITERKQFEEELKSAVKVRDEFMSICSHELKTPLTTMKLQAQMLSRRIQRGDPDAWSRDKAKNFAGTTERQLDRLSRLVDDMLDISKINNQKFQLEVEPVDLGALTAEVARGFEDQSEAAGCKIELKADPGVTGLWDCYRIEQVVSNLISNALKYGARGPVEIVVSRKEGVACLTVRDYGMGISRQHHERIFERFERAVSSKNVSGLGLGLYISRKIVHAHHGKIEVKSKEGEGSSFTVELPLAS